MTWMMHTPFLAFAVPSTGALLLQRWATALDGDSREWALRPNSVFFAYLRYRSRLRIRLPTKKRPGTFRSRAFYSRLRDFLTAPSQRFRCSFALSPSRYLK